MPNNVRANLELGAQIVIAIAIVVVAGVVVKRYLFPRQVSPASLPRITIGERLNVPNVDWEQNKSASPSPNERTLNLKAKSPRLQQSCVTPAQARF